MSGERGISLLEVVLATVLLGVSAAGLLGTINSALGGVRASREHSRAVMRATSVLDELLARPQLRAGQALQGSVGATSGWIAAIDPWPERGNRLQATGLVKVQVQVWWLSDGQRKTLTLDSYRREVIR